jgi:rRNA processing protein Krr1/Pno1
MQWQGGKSEYRRVQVPAHRFTPLKARWLEIYEPLVKHMKLQVRMNLKTKSVELRVGKCPRVLQSKISDVWYRISQAEIRDLGSQS